MTFVPLMKAKRAVRGLAVLALPCLLFPANGARAAVFAQQAGGGAAVQIAAEELRASARGAVERFYQRAGWRAVWSKEAVAGLDAALKDRARHGLEHVAFMPDTPSQASAVEREIRLTEAALRYARALANGLVDPESLHQIYTLPRAGADLENGLAQAVGDGRIESWLAGLAPADAEYRRLSQTYLTLRDEAAPGAPSPIRGPLLKVGDRDARVPAIARRLIDGEYLPPLQAALAEKPAEASLYTPEIAEAVKRLQSDFGIAADGVVGPNTLRVLNFGPADRARAVAVALERRRWLPRTPPSTRIDVNTAAARLYYYRDGVLVDTRRVVVGKPGTETPALQSPIFRLVANPTWTVPKSIQNGELAHVGPGYLRRHDMRLRNGWIVQGAGPGNALGLVKFDMENRHAIYLHDTSAPELFDRSLRHRSHGCVRVEDALGFAEMLARDEGVADAWARARSGGEQQFLELPQRIPVRLLYQNVFLTPEGEIAFRTDPYGWNGKIAKALGFGDQVETGVRSDQHDIAP